MGVSRTNNGDNTNWIEVYKGMFTGASTQCAWIMLNSLGTNQAICGNSYDSGYGMRISIGSRLEIFWSNGLVSDANTRSVPLLIADGAAEDYLEIGVPLFVAVVVNQSFVPIDFEFYAGRTPATIVLIGTASGGGPSIAPAGAVHVGLFCNNYGGLIQFPLDGALQRVGRWSGAMNLSQLRAVAVCDATPPDIPVILVLHWFIEMTGASPEPDSSPIPGDTVDDGIIHGILPIGPELCGPGVVEVSGAQLVTLM